ncbi:hypothetical protein CYMTET_30029 [Cymbomonas tetramitiformis]|uniref:Uncharacterized protein n=1 Tax=Cymbomonas tetramitiformis TaxID=36881 RepID=A0AAE0KUK9_9CHLO|nr:hypothetical protein CYMTET_30029 [Cymbomonas tetramitiformis]
MGACLGYSWDQYRRLRLSEWLHYFDLRQLQQPLLSNTRCGDILFEQHCVSEWLSFCSRRLGNSVLRYEHELRHVRGGKIVRLEHACVGVGPLRA